MYVMIYSTNHLQQHQLEYLKASYAVFQEMDSIQQLHLHI
ncbi:hypothetical protein BvCms1806_04036 [Escherichia coli]|nr:hypothetical protein BvCms1806_04036 [Escherichia coli]